MRENKLTLCTPPVSLDFSTVAQLDLILGWSAVFVCFFLIKTLSVLHPLKQPDAAIMQDTDLAGPLVFCLAFGGCLLLVSAVLNQFFIIVDN